MTVSNDTDNKVSVNIEDYFAQASEQPVSSISTPPSPISPKTNESGFKAFIANPITYFGAIALIAFVVVMVRK